MKHSSSFDMDQTGFGQLPIWVPDDARAYLAHVVGGKSMRQLARQKNGHASTISRFVQRLENRRDEPLVDLALSALEGRSTTSVTSQNQDLLKGNTMGKIDVIDRIATDTELRLEAKRILRRLCETATFLVMAPAMEKAAVMRKSEKGHPVKIAVLDRHIAQAFALKDWIECAKTGKVRTYHITSAGKAGLKRILANEAAENGDVGSFCEDAFLAQHKEWDDTQPVLPANNRRKKPRYNLAESPLTSLGRRKDCDGLPFLSTELIQAGEHLREDFEMAQMGARVTQNWDRFLVGGRSGGFSAGRGPAEGPQDAREHVAQALKFLGPGLGDIALRCCCFLEGMETAEKRMGWSARSGKIVLRIALQRLKQHYENAHTSLPPQ